MGMSVVSEKYTTGSIIRRTKLGLISAITAVGLNIEGKPDYLSYYNPGLETLNNLSDKKSDIYSIARKILEAQEETIAKAKETFPKEESLKYLIKLLEAFS